MTKNNQSILSVAIIGRPNVGKSSLLNLLIGQKISIVTHKTGTTRSAITGIVNVKNTQLILLDTPGIFEPKKSLEKAMVRCAWASLHNVDVVALVIDSTKNLDDGVLQIIKRLKAQKINTIFVLNKVDLGLSKHRELTSALLQTSENPTIFNISAKTGYGIKQLLKYFCSIAEQSEWVYEKDDITNLPMRFFASEITREQLFLKLDEELPYNLTVQTETWTEMDNGSIKINQVIVVSKENYKMIILGKNGSKIKEIGSKARLELEKFLDCRVHLFLFVKVRDWEDSPEYYDYMGLKLLQNN